MRYLKKRSDSVILENGWQYGSSSQRNKEIRETLLAEQNWYCAYTEEYISPITAADVEHFDDRLKGTEKDDYWNWYAVLHWLNLRKRPIEEFLPILLPYSDDLDKRIRYEDGQFIAIDPTDVEADNLIKFLGWNDVTLASERDRFIQDMREDFHSICDGDIERFRQYVLSRPKNLRFRTALEAEFGLLENEL